MTQFVENKRKKENIATQKTFIFVGLFVDRNRNI